MLQFLVLLCVCGSEVLSADYFMPGFSGRVQPNPTAPPTTVAPTPACDSCCPTPPPVDEDKVACAALDKRLVVLEDALRDHECSVENAGNCTALLFYFYNGFF